MRGDSNTRIDNYEIYGHHVLMTKSIVAAREPESRELISGQEAVEILEGVSYPTFMRWAREGKVRSVQYVDGGRRLFFRSDIEALRARSTVSGTENLELPGQERLPV